MKIIKRVLKYILALWLLLFGFGMVTYTYFSGGSTRSLIYYLGLEGINLVSFFLLLNANFFYKD